VSLADRLPVSVKGSEYEGMDICIALSIK
jgi:hypothetical protein